MFYSAAETTDQEAARLNGKVGKHPRPRRAEDVFYYVYQQKREENLGWADDGDDKGACRIT